MAAMSPSSLSQHPRATVCLACGDKGEAELLIYCRNCRDSAVHHYCMEKIVPEDDNIKWRCWDCTGKRTVKVGSSRKSARISSKKQKAQTMRNYWKKKLNQRKNLVRISKDINETGSHEADGYLLSKGLKANLVNERERDLNILEKEKSIPEIVTNSDCHELIKIDEPTFTMDITFHDEQEDKVKLYEEIEEIPVSGNSEKILLIKDSDNAQNDGKDVDLQVSLYAANNYLERDDSLSGEPLVDPVWRGRFNIKEEDSEITIEILAHLSSRACSKVSHAAETMPPSLDVKIVDNHAALPKHFRDATPTAASIGLYFFPACERDERAYDSLLEEVMDRELALKVVIDNLQLLIFPSSKLPLRNWRYNRKIYLWGVFKKMPRSYSSMGTTSERSNSIQLFGLSEAIATGSKEDLVCSQHADYPCQNYQSPMSMQSSQSSSIIPSNSMQNTPDSLALSLLS